MLKWALVFLVIALIAALFGFNVIATAAVDIALILFWVFVGVFLLLLLIGLFRGRP